MEETINLRKGDKVSVGFTDITVGLGWEPNEGTGGTFDLDVSAIMIDENRKLKEQLGVYMEKAGRLEHQFNILMDDKICLQNELALLKEDKVYNNL